MAEGKANLEGTLTCSICAEMLLELVVLPCQHSFCRQCIGLYADKSKCGHTDEASYSPGSEDVRQVISCPLCRVSNFQLAEVVERFSSDVKFEGNSPHCSVCGEENDTKAVKYCSNCCLLYCKECLGICHPAKGAFKRHCLISAHEYMSQGAPQSKLQTDTQSDPDLSCEKHGQLLVIYCVTCLDVICVGCLAEHPLHTVRDIQSAAEEDKVTVTSKSGHLEKTIAELEQILSQFKSLQNDIQANQNLHLEDIDKAYFAALDGLKTWRKDSVEALKSRHAEWRVQCAAAMKHLQMELEEMRLVQQSSQDLLSSINVQILKGSRKLSRRIDNQLAEMKTSLKKQEYIKQSLLESINSYAVDPRRVIVMEAESKQRIVRRLNITKARLTFTETTVRELRITDKGSMVECGDLSRVLWCTAVTDGRYNAGRYYWELEITVLPPSSSDSGCFCRVGVVHQSCGLSEYIKSGSDSWYTAMEYHVDEVKCHSHYGGEIKPDYQPHTGPQHLGLYLDCDQLSLTVLDCGHKQVMLTVTDLSLSQPLVPFVELERVKSGSARW